MQTADAGQTLYLRLCAAIREYRDGAPCLFRLLFPHGRGSAVASILGARERRSCCGCARNRIVAAACCGRVCAVRGGTVARRGISWRSRSSRDTDMALLGLVSSWMSDGHCCAASCPMIVMLRARVGASPLERNWAGHGCAQQASTPAVTVCAVGHG